MTLAIKYMFLLLTATLTSAWTAPEYDGFSLVWSEDFAGADDAILPNQKVWNIIDADLDVNAELEVSESRCWSSGRIESKYSFTPEAGKRTVVEAYIRFGNNSADTKQGIRHGVQWPGCGELDILEILNSQSIGRGTAHCDVPQKGRCNEPVGLNSSVVVMNQGWCVPRLIPTRPRMGRSVQPTHVITWHMNEKQFHRVTGDQIGDSGVWSTLAQTPMFFILNVAVSGTLPGNPNGKTKDGYGAMMEVGYVARGTEHLAPGGS
ncbi:concanavalin A-like lectin/glucanase domain-containing protein [Cercophora newfieldiana]|uniref:Concanavalin A-like lectin/glucanase domain-containing protein n=1 Tax=Cercophora newfieldiana TaxID=92897 RepID=A0AA39Y397_9PEZI|nr:concanavalin A-like lectin/glucanase domain-containing protein [Cercophora newfieldiana]